jgi:hypothetical protein
MAMTREERISGHKKQERLQVKGGIPTVASLEEGVPVLRSTGKGLVEYVRYNNALYQKVFDKTNTPDIAIDNYIITWTLNKPTAGSANTIDDGNTVGDDNEGGQAIADLTEKVNSILNILRVKSIIK